MATIPSIAMIPSGVKASKLYSVLPTDGAGDFTTTRASVATRVNESGLIEEVAANVSRLDYSDGTCPSLLLENSATNLITYSEDFSNVAWTKTRTSILINNSISPEGTLTADKIIPSIDNSTHRVDFNYALTDNSTYTYSIFAKKGEYNCFALQIGGTSISPDSAEFNLNTGVSTSGGGTIISSKIEPLANDWFKCSLTMLAGVSDIVNLGIGNDNVYSFAGDGTSGLYLWGAQLEQNSYATSYIKTVGTTQTRVADTASGAGNSTVINSTEGVLFFNLSTFTNPIDTFRYIGLSDGTNNNTIQLSFYSATNKYNFVVRENSSSVISQSITSVDYSDFVKVAIKYKSGDTSYFVNGVKIGTNSSTYTFTSPISQLDFGLSFTNSGDFYGKVKSLQVYTTALSDAELTALTTI